MKNKFKQMEQTIFDKYSKQEEYYTSLCDEKFKKLRKDRNEYYDIYNYGISYYSDKLNDEPYGSDNYYKIKEKMDDLYNKHHALEKPIKILKFEVDIYWEISSYYLDKMTKHCKKKINKFTKKDTPLKTITKTKRKQLESELCPICLDTHTYKTVIQLNCSHIFGKCCIQNLLQRSEKKGTDLKCPLCRSECKKYSLFKMK